MHKKYPKYHKINYHGDISRPIMVCIAQHALLGPTMTQTCRVATAALQLKWRSQVVHDVISESTAQAP